MSDSLIFYIDFTKDFIKVMKLWHFFDSTPEIHGYDSGNTFLIEKKDIEIQNISYGYGKANIFEAFSLAIAHGKKTAFV